MSQSDENPFGEAINAAGRDPSDDGSNLTENAVNMVDDIERLSRELQTNARRFNSANNISTDSITTVSTMDSAANSGRARSQSTHRQNSQSTHRQNSQSTHHQNQMPAPGLQFDLSKLDLTQLAALLGTNPQFQSLLKTNTTHATSTTGNTLGVTGLSIGSGLETIHVGRSNAQQKLAGIISKHDRGATPNDRAKRKKIVTQPLKSKLTCNNALSVLSAEDSANFDVAKECITWQNGLRELEDIAQSNDMLGPFKIPEQFELTSPTVSGNFNSLIEHFSKFTIEEVAEWRQWLSTWAAPVELESDNWMAEIMDKSMDTALSTTVHEALAELPESARGGVTRFKLMVDEMVLVNQETLDALATWLREFDIRRFDGQNVKIASAQCRAVIRALDGHGLPDNMVRNLLSGFAFASNEEFRQQCATLLAVQRSSYLTLGMAKQNPKKVAFAIMKDLESTFAAISARKMWEGAGHSAATYAASALDNNLTALAARHAKPFEEWVKDIECRNCGEIGHLEKDCPKKKKSNRYSSRDRARDTRGRRPQRRKYQEQKARKIYNAVMDQIAAQSDDESISDEQATPRAYKAKIDDDDNSVESDSDSEKSVAAHAARMFDSLKE